MGHQNKTLFPGQQPTEQILMVLRQHWAVLAMKLSLWFVMLVLYFVLDYVALTYGPQFVEAQLLPLLDLARVAYLMFLLLGLFIIFVLYYLNMHIITNERIVDVEQRGLLHHTISELHLNQIQDVTAEVHGLPENLLDYGDVYIQTAGETERFVFRKVPNPTKVTKTILDLYEHLSEEEKHFHHHTYQAPPQPTQNRPA